MTIRTMVAALFLAGQAALVLAGLFREDRWFTWAPHAVQVRYRIAATLDGRPLDAAEVARRLGLRAEGWEAHAARNLEDIIEQYLRTYGRAGQWRVTLHYSVNGRPEEERTWSTGR